MESNEDASLPSIVVPGPEVREKIDKFAGRLSTREKRDADEMVAKVLASPKRDAFVFLDSSHVFYPYFLSKLSEYRQHPERAPESKEAKAGAASSSSAPPGGPASPTAAQASTTVTTRVNGYVRTEGGSGAHHSDPKREELLRQTEQEARRYLQDPFPNYYSLDLKAGTVDVPALLMDVITCTAQYVAKYGEPFLSTVQSRQKHNPTFRFLQPDDVRHGVFKGLVASYKRILASDPETTETRLENLQKPEYVLETVCSEKTKYAQAALARRKAALLTDDELRAKLHWATFKVVKSFTLSDLMLDGPVPERRAPADAVAAKAKPKPEAPPAPAATPSAPPVASEGSGPAPTTIQPPGGAPTFTPVFMSSELVTSTTTDDPTGAPSGGSSHRHGGRHHHQRTHGMVEVVEDYTPQAVAPVRRGVDYFVDAETGEKLRAEDVGSGGAGVGGGQPVELKRDRESYGLASEDEVAREIRRRTG